MANSNVDNTSISIPDVKLTIKNCNTTRGRSSKPLARKGLSIVHSLPQNVTNEITPVSVINNITTRRVTRASFRKDEIKNDAIEESANKIPIAVIANKKRQTRKRKINCTSVHAENSQNFTPSKMACTENVGQQHSKLIECDGNVDSKSDNLVARDNNETSDMDDAITDNRNDAVLSANIVKRNITIASNDIDNLHTMNDLKDQINDIAVNVLPTEMQVNRELSINDKSNEKINNINNIEHNGITDDTSSLIEIPSNEYKFILSSTSPSSLPSSSSSSSSIKKFSKVNAEKLIFRKVHANVTFLMKNRGLKPNLSCAKRLSTPIHTRD